MPALLKLKSAVHGLAYRSGLSAAIARQDPSPRIIMFHGVAAAEANDFREQVRFLKTGFRLVSLGELVTGLRSANCRNLVCLTFDDGLRNNHSVVYPILEELNAPATFFVCPGLIELSKWLWNHEARERLRSLPEADRIYLATAISSPSKEVVHIVEWMKTLDFNARNAAEELIRTATPDFAPSPEQREKFDLMSWNELAELDSKLVTVGSHSYYHPILAALAPQAIDFEVSASRKALEERLGRPIEFFCYPNGDFNPEAEDAVRRNYTAAVSTECGFVTETSNLHRLPRIPSSDDPALLAWRMHRPSA